MRPRGARLGCCPLLQQVNRREESHLVLAGRLPLSTYVEVWLAMRGTDYALLVQLGRITGGVAVLGPQGTPANLPELPRFCLRVSGRHRHHQRCLVRLPKRTRGRTIYQLISRGIFAKKKES